MRRIYATGWTLLLALSLILSFTFNSSKSWGLESDSDAPVSLEQCRAQLLSGDFSVMDLRRDNRVMPNIARHFAKIIDEMIEHKGEKDVEKGKDRFDRARANLLERIIDGRWGMSETSDDILSDCFFAVHPEADVEN